MLHGDCVFKNTKLTSKSQIRNIGIANMHNKYRRQDRDPRWLASQILARWCSNICIYFHTEDMPAQALYCHRYPPHKTPAFNYVQDRSTRTKHSCVCTEHFTRGPLVCNTVQLALGTALMLEYLSENVGLVLACLPCGSINSTASRSP